MAKRSRRFSPTGRIGVTAVEQIFLREFGWIPQSQDESDQGIDLHVEVCDDGSVIGTLHLVALEGLANWLLAHGGAAEVLEPADLRAAVVDRAREALAHYEGDSVDEDGIPYL